MSRPECAVVVRSVALVEKSEGSMYALRLEMEPG